MSTAFDQDLGLTFLLFLWFSNYMEIPNQAGVCPLQK